MFYLTTSYMCNKSETCYQFWDSVTINTMNVTIINDMKST